MSNVSIFTNEQNYIQVDFEKNQMITNWDYFHFLKCVQSWCLPVFWKHGHVMRGSALETTGS